MKSTYQIWIVHQRSRRSSSVLLLEIAFFGLRFEGEISKTEPDPLGELPKFNCLLLLGLMIGLTYLGCVGSCGRKFPYLTGRSMWYMPYYNISHFVVLSTQ